MVNEKVLETLKQMSNVFKVDVEKIKEEFNSAMEFANSQFKNLEESGRIDKALQQVASKYKVTTGANTSNYTGIIIGVSGETSDMHDYDRRMQMKIYIDTLKAAEENGNMSLVDELMGITIDKDENGDIVPLYPYYKKDGTISQRAGQKIPKLTDSLYRTVIGFCFKDGNNPENDLRPFTLSLTGKAIDTIPPIGKIVSFKAGGKIYNDDYNLNSGVTDFVENENSYLQEGIDKIGLNEMVKKFFGDKVISYLDVEKMYQDYKDGNSSAVPNEYKYKYVIVENVNCMAQNFVPNDKGKISMQFCNDEFSINSVVMYGSTMPTIGDKIEFAPLSSCVVIGQLSIFGNEEPVCFMNLFGAIGVKDKFIPRIEAEEIKEEQSTIESTQKAW